MRVTVGAGRLRIEALHGAGAGAQNVNIRPPIGREWLLYELHIYHNDGAARQIVIQRTDGVTTFTLTQDAAHASGSHAILIPTNETADPSAPNIKGPLRITRDCFLIVYSGSVWTDGTSLDINCVIDDAGRGN